MRWAFWRRRRSAAEQAREQAPEQGPDAPARPTWPPAPAPVARAAGGDEPDPERRPTPAFSGASPDPGGAGTPADDLEGMLGVLRDGPSALDVPAVRGDVADLVRAALGRDAAAAAGVVERLTACGGEAPSLASVAALAVLGERLAAAAEVDPSDVAPGSPGAAAAVAQGDTVALRAEPLLRTVAPHCPRGLVRLVVRFCLGTPEADPAVAHHLSAAEQDIALVAAVLLAQTILDGQGDLVALEQELTDLLPY